MKNIIKTIMFIIMFFVILGKVSEVFKVPLVELEYPTILYEENNSVDAVYIGSSDCYTFWNPLIAWEKYGITVQPYAFSTQPILVTEYLIREARKKQEDAVFIVNINTIHDTVSDVTMHRILDHMPLSLNKLRLTKYMTDLKDLSFKESLEFYFPIIKYHTRWKDFEMSNFTYKNNNMKSVNSASSYLKNSVNISSAYTLSNKTQELSNIQMESLENLLNYCDEENIKILFVTVPRAENNIKDVEKSNTVKKIISERGYTVLDLRDKRDEIGLDLEIDYYNRRHTNIHGAIKFTDYMSQYLIKNFDFKNKSNSSKYNDWKNAYNKYYKTISKHVLDIELNKENRDYSLKPHFKEDIKVAIKNDTINITWTNIEGATGYAIYRKDTNTSWKRIGVTSETEYIDENIKKRTFYNYTIVPYYEENGTCYYGNYFYNGNQIET